MQFILQEIGKQHAVLVSIQTESSNTKISECLGVTLMTVQKIWKELDESNGAYEVTEAWKSHSYYSGKKRTAKFFDEIQAMIDNNPSKLISSIVRNMGVSEFLIRQVVHEDIWYFSYKMRKGIFITGYENTALQSFWTNSSFPSNWMCFGFSQMRKISARIKWSTHRTTVSLVCLHKI